jgi:hypothetical protein
MQTIIDIDRDSDRFRNDRGRLTRPHQWRAHDGGDRFVLKRFRNRLNLHPSLLGQMPFGDFGKRRTDTKHIVLCLSMSDEIQPHHLCHWFSGQNGLLEQGIDIEADRRDEIRLRDSL